VFSGVADKQHRQRHDCFNKVLRAPQALVSHSSAGWFPPSVQSYA
jgi:hypothetical protein